jgi:hypothetical protein
MLFARCMDDDDNTHSQFRLENEIQHYLEKRTKTILSDVYRRSSDRCWVATETSPQIWWQIGRSSYNLTNENYTSPTCVFCYSKFAYPTNHKQIKGKTVKSKNKGFFLCYNPQMYLRINQQSRSAKRQNVCVHHSSLWSCYSTFWANVSCFRQHPAPSSMKEMLGQLACAKEAFY